jgi:DNA-binding CsgD family transcriptional regulator/PAS domain-containing protein
MQSEEGYVSTDVNPESMYATADLSVVLGQLNESPLSDDLWRPVLSRLCEITQSSTGFLITGEDHTGLAVRAQSADHPHDAALVNQYNETYADKDPFRQPVLQSGRTGVVDAEELLPNAGLMRTELYRDQLQPRGLRYAMFVVTAASAERIEAVSLWRTMIQGPFHEESRRLLELLYPHIQKSMELRHVLRSTERRIAGIEAMLDVSPTATFLVTRRGHLLHRNAAADALLGEGDVLSLENGTLVSASNQSREALRTLLQKTGAGAGKPIPALPGKTTITVQRKSGGPPLYLLAVPLEPADRRRSRADVMLLVSDPGDPVTVPHEILASIYGLTPALAEVANGLLKGYSLEYIAELRQVSIGTVRQQLKSILSRTETVRQSDLVRLLLSLPRTLVKK